MRNCEEVGLFSDLELDQVTEQEPEDAKRVSKTATYRIAASITNNPSNLVLEPKP